mgnify:CR=1 FL=1
MREGAFDYLTKPFDNDELRALVARALDLSRLERENRFLREEVRARYGPETIVAESAQSRAMLDLVRRVAPSRAAVLVQGESGTGKELVARLLHFWSDRVGKPFVAVNVKAFAEGVVESELFGHERRRVHRRRRGRGRAASSARTAARSSSTRSARSAPTCRRSSCARVQEGEVQPVGADRGRAASTSGSSPRRTACSATRSPPAASARTSTSA